MMGDAREIVTNLSGMKVYLIDENHMMTETELDPSRFTLEKNQVVFIRG